MSLSIDGIEKEHDNLRGVIGNYERIIESDKVLRHLRTKYKNLYYIINSVFLGQNEDNILNTIKKNKIVMLNKCFIKVNYLEIKIELKTTVNAMLI